MGSEVFAGLTLIAMDTPGHVAGFQAVDFSALQAEEEVLQRAEECASCVAQRTLNAAALLRLTLSQRRQLHELTKRLQVQL